MAAIRHAECHACRSLGPLPRWEGAGISCSWQNQRIPRKEYKDLLIITVSAAFIRYLLGARLCAKHFPYHPRQFLQQPYDSR